MRHVRRSAPVVQRWAKSHYLGYAMRMHRRPIAWDAPMTTRGTWKNTERRVAKIIGGKRVPVTGRARGDVPDIEHEVFAVEVKHWRVMPKRVVAALAQAEAARGVNSTKIPVAVIHGAGDELRDAIVVMRLHDFADLCGA